MSLCSLQPRCRAWFPCVFCVFFSFLFLFFVFLNLLRPEKNNTFRGKRKKRKKKEKKKRTHAHTPQMSSTKVDLKVIVLGKESIGKTCLVHRYLYGRYKFQSSVIFIIYLFIYFEIYIIFYRRLEQLLDLRKLNKMEENSLWEFG